MNYRYKYQRQFLFGHQDKKLIQRAGGGCYETAIGVNSNFELNAFPGLRGCTAEGFNPKQAITAAGSVVLERLEWTLGCRRSYEIGASSALKSPAFFCTLSALTSGLSSRTLA